MNFLDLTYDYLIFAVIGILISLCAVLMVLRVSNDKEYEPYRKARKSLAMVFAVIAVDLSLSLAAYKMQLHGHVDTIIDVLFYTPVAFLFWNLVDTLVDMDTLGKFRKTLLIIWAAIIVVGIANELAPVEELSQLIFTIVAAVWAGLIIFMGINIIVTLHKAVVTMDNYYSENIANRLTWLRKGFSTFLVWGIFSPLAAVGPSWFNAFYASLGGVIYVYLAASFINYGYNYRNLKILSDDKTPGNTSVEVSTGDKNVSESIKEWEKNKEYRHQGITVRSMAEQLQTSTSSIITTIYNEHNCSFHEYVCRLRVRDAQELLVHFADKDITEIAHMVGFESLEDIETNFRNTVYVTPEEWRAGVLRLIN